MTSDYTRNLALSDRLDIIADKCDCIIRLLKRMEIKEMSRYTDLRDKVRGLRSQGAALREMLKTLDGGSEEEYKELTDEIQANADEMAAAIAENTPPPTGSAGNVPQS